MTTEQGASPEGGPRFSLRAKLIIGGSVAAAVVVLYFILAAFIPRWWAQRVAGMVEGSFTKGIWWGVIFGFLSTAVPVLLLAAAWWVWRRRGGKVLAGAAGVLALLAASPNLMTLAVVLGGGSGAHAGQRIMDVDAPAFRGASLVGALAVVLLGATLLVLRFRRRRLRRDSGDEVKPSATHPTPPPDDAL